MKKLVFIISSIALSISLSGNGDKMPDQRPNMLFILTDDQSKVDMSAYGNIAIGTPNMDQLASESMIFENAFTSTAMCVPSRSSLLTGLHPFRHGAVANHAPILQSTVCVATYLDQLGYNVGLIGKQHINPIGQFEFDYFKNLLDFDWDSKLTKDEIRRAFEALNVNSHPFVLFVCISNPHTPWPGEWDKDPEEVQLPEHLYDNEETRLAVSRYYAHVKVADQKVGETVEVAKYLGLYDDMIVFFSSDHGAELVHGKYTLYDAGINVPFTVRWPGVVPPNSRSNAMIQFVDVVPTMIDIARGKPIDSLDGKSFLPVLQGNTNDHNDFVFGTSYKDGNKTDYPIICIRGKNYKYLLNLEHQETYTSWITDSTLGDKWPGYERHYGYWLTWIEAAKTDEVAEEMVRNYLHRPFEELYNLQSDPSELNNIIDNESTSKIRMELKAKLKNWIKEQNGEHYFPSLGTYLTE